MEFKDKIMLHFFSEVRRPNFVTFLFWSALIVGGWMVLALK